MAVGAFFQRLKEGLTKSRETWVQKIGTIFQNRQWDENSLGEMEESLDHRRCRRQSHGQIDAGAAPSVAWRNRRSRPGNVGQTAERPWSRCCAARLRHPDERRFRSRPWVIIFLGVNGVGKTTTIGKLAAQYRNDGKKVLDGGWRHLSRRRHRTARCLGQAGRCRCGQTQGGRRSVSSGIRRNASG